MSKSDTVRYIYERFAEGDAAVILATFDGGIEFRLAEGHPYAPEGKAWIGGDEITRNFFMKAGAEWQDWSFNVEQTIETPDAVVVEGRYSSVYKPTGHELDAQACHVWRFRDSRIVSFHQYVDTARVQHVMGTSICPHEASSVFPGVPIAGV